MVSEPTEEFLAYQHQKMYEFYGNYLEYILTYLFDDCSIEGLIKNHLINWGIKKDTLQPLKNFLTHLENFYKKHEESDDFTLLRDNYWNEFSKEAQECVKLLEQDLANMED